MFYLNLKASGSIQHLFKRRHVPESGIQPQLVMVMAQNDLIRSVALILKSLNLVFGLLGIFGLLAKLARDVSATVTPACSDTGHDDGVARPRKPIDAEEFRAHNDRAIAKYGLDDRDP